MAKKKSQKSFDGGPVGYGKPPANHQFEKGMKKPEGSGRQKGAKNLRTTIEEFLDGKMTVTISGERANISRKELIVRAGYEKAMNGNSVRDLEALVRLLERLAPQSVDPLPPILVESIPGDEGL